MGFYIDPHDASKEDWLTANGREIKQADAKTLFCDSQELPVCLADNGGWTVAAVAYAGREVDRLINGMDGRRNWWYAVPREKLYEVCPELKVQMDWCQVEGGTVG